MKLLIVEDEADLREALAMALKDEGYAVDQAEDGEEGFYMAVEWNYDAIILDIMMPRMNGWEVMEKLRKVKDTPVLILTARGAVDDRIRGLDLGSDDFMVKPFDMDELAARLRALIRRAAGKSTATLSFQELEIDTVKKTVSVEGSPVKLTALEYALVHYLMMHRDAVVSRTELYEHLFNEDDDSLSNVLDVHVCNARRKLGGAYIKTRRGLGYTMGA
ncbi:response regulator transcription factor [Pontiella agarivorans]|uniref:Response regulator transcription factor n=1 Tax=Pontiella agarivorans TaxID=3038953 RepID=A0ABU5MVU2_9BACT|nr:response regulator transcription factor [Pontiella agarivorans]MDZ8118319.1 response regulator transcription factor [Pontiella agarivorans]